MKDLFYGIVLFGGIIEIFVMGGLNMYDLCKYVRKIFGYGGLLFFLC